MLVSVLTTCPEVYALNKCAINPAGTCRAAVTTDNSALLDTVRFCKTLRFETYQGTTHIATKCHAPLCKEC